MGFIKGLFSGQASKLVDSVTNFVDKSFTSDEERLEAKRKLQEEVNSHVAEMERLSIERERLASDEYKKALDLAMVDSKSESALTRLIRPSVVGSGVVLVFFYILVSVVPALFGYTIEVPLHTQKLISDYLGVWKQITMLYFGVRMMDKNNFTLGKK